MAEVVTYLRGDALAWWRDVGEEQLGTAVFFLQFKTAFLAKFVKASDSLTARIDLEACKQEGMSVGAYASKFKSIASRIMVGCQLDRTTQAQWFLKGLNVTDCKRLPLWWRENHTFSGIDYDLIGTRTPMLNCLSTDLTLFTEAC